MKKYGMSLVTLSITVVVLAALTHLTIISLDKGKILEMVEPVINYIRLENIKHLANIAYSKIYSDNLTNGIRRQITANEIRKYILEHGVEEIELQEYTIKVENGDVFVERKGEIWK